MKEASRLYRYLSIYRWDLRLSGHWGRGREARAAGHVDVASEQVIRGPPDPRPLLIARGLQSQCCGAQGKGLDRDEVDLTSGVAVDAEHVHVAAIVTHGTPAQAVGMEDDDPVHLTTRLALNLDQTVALFEGQVVPSLPAERDENLLPCTCERSEDGGLRPFTDL